MSNVSAEAIQAARYELVSRGYAEIIWVHQDGVTTDLVHREMLLHDFLDLWTGDYEPLVKRYCELMGVKVKPRIGSSRFHDPGKTYREEMDRIEKRVAMKQITEDEANEVKDLRERIKWAAYHAAAGGASPPASALENPHGFLVGNPRARAEVAWRQWSLRNRNVALSDDFLPWLEVVSA